jgi:hypothetical protein
MGVVPSPFSSVAVDWLRRGVVLVLFTRVGGNEILPKLDPVRSM